MNLDMDKVTLELTGFALSKWPLENHLSSSVMSTKYPILHKIAIANFLPRMHIFSVSKDFNVFLFFIGTDEQFDIKKVIF